MEKSELKMLSVSGLDPEYPIVIIGERGYFLEGVGLDDAGQLYIGLDSIDLDLKF